VHPCSPAGRSSGAQGALSAALRLSDGGPRVAEVDGLIAELRRARFGDTCNFYSDAVPGAGERRERLRRYLTARWSAPVLLVGEAPGWAGARLSGIAFTSEHQLGLGPQKEPSATIVHRVLAELGAEDTCLLWNACPSHPFRPGHPRSNRRPTALEVAAGRPFLEALRHGRRVVAVGRVAAAALGGGAHVRHPSHGGATRFRDGLAVFLAEELAAPQPRRCPGPTVGLEGPLA